MQGELHVPPQSTPASPASWMPLVQEGPKETEKVMAVLPGVVVGSTWIVMPCVYERVWGGGGGGGKNF